MKIVKHRLFHMFVRWALGGHGILHLIETAMNIYEKAWYSAGVSAFAGFLMIAGATIDMTHHNEEQNEGR